jgi:hypothetical protein
MHYYILLVFKNANNLKHKEKIPKNKYFTNESYDKMCHKFKNMIRCVKFSYVFWHEPTSNQF